VRGVRGDFPSYSLRWVWRLAGFPALAACRCQFLDQRFNPSMEASVLLPEKSRHLTCDVGGVDLIDPRHSCILVTPTSRSQDLHRSSLPDSEVANRPANRRNAPQRDHSPPPTMTSISRPAPSKAILLSVSEEKFTSGTSPDSI